MDVNRQNINTIYDMFMQFKEQIVQICIPSGQL